MPTTPPWTDVLPPPAVNTGEKLSVKPSTLDENLSKTFGGRRHSKRGFQESSAFSLGLSQSHMEILVSPVGLVLSFPWTLKEGKQAVW